MYSSLIVAFSCLSLLAIAQNFVVPTTWRKPTSTLSRSAREGLAHAVVDSLTTSLFKENGNNPNLIAPPYQGASLVSAVIQTDRLSGNTTYSSLALSQINNVVPELLNPDSGPGTETSFVAPWGLAVMDAFSAYRNNDSLDLAKSVWNRVSALQIQPDDVERGTFPLKNLTLPSQCNGASVAGGVYGVNGSIDSIVDAISTGTFMALSAQLFQVTHDVHYAAAAALAAEFLQSQLYNGTVLLDDLLTSDCSTSKTFTASAQGFALEGLAYLTMYNSTFTPFLRDMISSTIFFSAWTGQDGIFNQTIPSHDILESIFMRGLNQARRMSRSPQDPAAILIESYILVQFNALLDLGPTSPTQLDPLGQQGALDILNSAFDLAQNPRAPERSRPPVPIIVGATVGGAVLVALVLLSLFLLRRRRQRRINQSYVQKVMEQTAVPFVDESRGPLILPEKRDASADNGSRASALRSDLRTTPATAPSDVESEDLAAVPQLVERLNRIMARLPPGGVDEVNPPRYED